MLKIVKGQQQKKKKNTLTGMLQEKKFSKPTILLFAQQALMSTISSKGQKL